MDTRKGSVSLIALIISTFVVAIGALYFSDLRSNVVAVVIIVWISVGVICIVQGQSKNSNAVAVTWAVLSIMLVVVYNILSDDEIESFGVNSWAYVEEISVGKRVRSESGRYAGLHYDVDGREFRFQIESDSLKIGDSVRIVYSNRQPEIMRVSE